MRANISQLPLMRGKLSHAFLNSCLQLNKKCAWLGGKVHNLFILLECSNVLTRTKENLLNLRTQNQEFYVPEDATVYTAPRTFRRRYRWIQKLRAHQREALQHPTNY
jgi:hypothetical protein